MLSSIIDTGSSLVGSSTKEVVSSSLGLLDTLGSSDLVPSVVKLILGLLS